MKKLFEEDYEGDWRGWALDVLGSVGLILVIMFLMIGLFVLGVVGLV